MTVVAEQIKMFNDSRTVLAAGALMAMMLFAISHESDGATVAIPPRHFNLLEGHDAPRGIWSNGTSVWIVENQQDIGEQKVPSYNLVTGERSYHLEFFLDQSHSKMEGIWSDSTVMWISDWDDKKLYAYTLATQSTLNQQRLPNRDISLASDNDSPGGVWGFSNTIFVVDKRDTYVYAYSKTDGTRLRNEEFDLAGPNGHPWGIWGQGTMVWISDSDDGMLYAYERNPNSSSHGDRLNNFEIRLPRGNNDPRGIWSDGEIMWVVDNDDAKMYAMHFRDFRHPNDEVDIAHVDTPTGLWTDGDTMWVADAGRSDYGKLLAYKLTDQTRNSSKDVQLADFNKEPLSIWSDGEFVWAIQDFTGANHFLYAYYMEPDADEIGLLAPYKSVTLDSDNSDPRGTWSNGEDIWVSDSVDDKLYAYNLPGKSRQADQDLDLHSQNDDPAEIWSNGHTVWVMDKADKLVYAYRLSDGQRRRSQEFSTVPENDDPSGGLTGHGLRLWVADSDDEKLYAYGRINTPPAFSETSANFKVHHTIAAGDFVGSVPEVTDPDGDTILYLLTSGGLGVFDLDYQTGNISIRDDAAGFSGGEEYTLTVAITDSKGGLDGLDGSADDAINVKIHVTSNADPEIGTPDGTIFTVAENAGQEDTIAQLDITDLDGDTLFYQTRFTPYGPFWIYQGEVKLLTGRTLDYESTNFYSVTTRVRDNKNESAQTDFSWDDEIEFSIQVTNVDEEGEIILGSAHPQVGTEIIATLRDPDGVDLTNGNQINWAVRSANQSLSNWTQVSSTDTSSVDFGYSPVALDAGETLQFRATYPDNSDNTQSKTLFENTANTVLALPPSNLPPTFDESSPRTRSVAEDVAGGGNIGSPVSATDPEGDTLTYLLFEYYSDHFVIDAATGQISLKVDELLDYESARTHYMRVVVLDGKDRDGNDNSGVVGPGKYDISSLVTVSVASVEEAGIVTLSSNHPEVGEALTARLADPDGSIANLSWQWQIADSNPSDAWIEIAGATLDSYLPTVNDIGKYLRAIATYDDSEGTGEEAIGTAANAVHRPENEAAEFDEGETATRPVDENAVAGTKLGAAVTASDPDGDALTYSLATGSDADKFVVDSTTSKLEVASGAALDFETGPTLQVTLQVSDGLDPNHAADSVMDDTIIVTIELVNVDEPGEVTLSSGEPMVGEPITATLTDLDGGISATTWSWEKSQDGLTDWEAISGASSDTYTPVDADENMFLRSVAGYTDGQGSGKSTMGMSADVVQPGRDDDDEDEEQVTPTQDDRNEGITPQDTVVETFREICRRDRNAGLVANCVMNSFGTARVELDGSYTIDWSEWDEDHSGMTGYPPVLQQFIYKSVYENGVEIDVSTLSDVYESCGFANGQWNCERPIKSSYFEDCNGNSLEPEEVVANSNQTQWSSALDSPGRRTEERTFQRWSGDASDLSNEPVPVTYTTRKFEMRLHYFQAHDVNDRAGVIGVNGANGFD